MSASSHDNNDHDARLTAIYRVTPRDAPPAAIDAAILAAARREVAARPHPAGFSFMRSWRVPLSIAAVMVLSVSLVTLMREEAPEFPAPPSADTLATQASRDSPSRAEEPAAPGDRGFVRDPQQSKNIGLKSPLPATSPGLGMRPPEIRARPTAADGSAAPAKDASAPAPAKRRDAFAGNVEPREAKVAAPTEQTPEKARLDTQRDMIAHAPVATLPRAETAKPAQVAQPVAHGAAPVADASSVAGVLAENRSQVRPAAAGAGGADTLAKESAPVNNAPARQMAKAAPAAAPVMSPPAPAGAGKLEREAELTPEKWLQRIEELRKAGRVDEGKASLAEFRKRYPDWRLPDSLRDWAQP